MKKYVGAVSLLLLCTVLVASALADYWQDKADAAKAEMDAAKLGAEFGKAGLIDNYNVNCTTWLDIRGDEIAGDNQMFAGVSAEGAGNTEYVLGNFAGAWLKYCQARDCYILAIGFYEDANDHANECDGSGGCGIEGHGGAPPP